MDYGNILSRAWKITWNNKILWILGFLAGAGGGFNSGSSGGGDGGGGAGPNNPPDILPPELQRQFERPEVIGIILAIVCVLLLIALAFFVLSLIARGGLIGGIRLADDNGTVKFGEAWAIGRRYFWRTLGLTVLLIIPAILLGIVGAAFVFLTLGFGALCILPLICVFVILYIPYSAVMWLAQLGVVLEDLSVFDAVRRGWELLKANVAPVLILGLILLVVGLLIGVALLIPLVIVAIPAVFAFVSDPQNPNIPLLVGAGLAFLCFLPVLWTISGALTTWIYSAWTLFYRQLIGQTATPSSPQPV